jgi:adiponectin receptor
MCFITAFGASAVTASLVPAFQAPELRPLRAALFSLMGVSRLVPVAHKLLLYGGRREAVATACYEAFMGALYGLGAAVYSARVLERWLPGRFNLVGHSHQLFHLFVIAGAYATTWAASSTSSEGTPISAGDRRNAESHLD